MHPHERHSTNPFALLRSLWQHRQLIVVFTKREIISRYRGSMIGLAWSVIIPILLLTVYTFVFSFVFKTRWGVGIPEGRTFFAVVLFVGLIIYNLFAEMLSRGPNLIVNNTNYVKKVIFPLEILPVVSLCSALFQALISFGVLFVAMLIFNGSLHASILFLPLVILPFLIMALGFSWILAALGVFVRDLSQVMSIIVMMLMFLSPVFYPLTAVPPNLRNWLMLNPITDIINQARNVVIFGQAPDWQNLLIYTGISLLFAWFGFWWFQKTRQGFADVL